MSERYVPGLALAASVVISVVVLNLIVRLATGGERGFSCGSAGSAVVCTLRY